MGGREKESEGEWGRVVCGMGGDGLSDATRRSAATRQVCGRVEEMQEIEMQEDWCRCRRLR